MKFPFIFILVYLSSLAASMVPAEAQRPRPVLGEIVAHDPTFAELVAPDAEMEVIAAGFNWAEGPVWDRANDRLLWTDVPENTIYQWKRGAEDYSVFMQPSGFTGGVDGVSGQGANGLAFDAAGRLLMCEHGDRRVSVLTPGGGKLTLADHYDGKRFNSPNDLCVHSSGAIFFTDPPYGLPGGENCELRELDVFGVYRLDPDGAVTLLDDALVRPNGIALSPDEKTLYVAQSHRPAQKVFAWDLRADGSVGERRVLFDATELGRDYRGLPDGLKVDRDGNIWTTGPGGVLVISPQGVLLGHIRTTRATANLNWGEDGSVLYMTADFYVLRLQTKTRGDGW